MVMDAVPEVVDSADTWAVWDGHRSSGQWAFTLATRKAIEQAADHGIAIGMVHNYNVAGSFGAYIQMAIDAGMVAMANTSLPLVSPWGGMENVLSGAPFAAGIPGGDLPPIISDVSMIDAQAAKRRPGVDEIFLPGERGARHREDAGPVAVLPAHWEPFERIVAEEGLSLDQLRSEFASRGSLQA